MNIFKKLLQIVLILISIAFIFFAVLLFSPQLQKKLVNRAVKGHADTFHVDTVNVGLSRVELKDVRFFKDQNGMAFDSFLLDYSIWSVISGKGVNIKQLDISNLNIDATNKTATGTTEKEVEDVKSEKETKITLADPVEVVKNTIDSFKSLLAVKLGTVKMNGTLHLPDQRIVVFKVEGENVQIGKEGLLNAQVFLTDNSPDAPVKDINFDGKVNLKSFDEAGDLVNVASHLKATGPALAKPAELKVDISLKQLQKDKEYAIDLVCADSLVDATKPLVQLGLRVDTVLSEIEVNKEINIDSKQIEPFVLGQQIPGFNLNYTGTSMYGLKNERVVSKGDLDLNINSLESVLGEGSSLKPLSINASIDLESAKKRLDLKDLKVTVSDNEKQTWLRADLLKPTAFDLKTLKPIAKEASEVFEVELIDLPLSIANSFLDPSINIVDGLLSGKMNVRLEKDLSIKAYASQALSLLNLNINKDNESFVSDVNVITSPSVLYKHPDITISYDAIKVESKSEEILKVSGSLFSKLGNNQHLEAKGSTDINIHNLFKQPFLKDVKLEKENLLNFVASHNLKLLDNIITLNQFDMSLLKEAKEEIMNISAAKDISLSTDMTLSELLKQQGDLLKVKLNNVPLTLISPFLPVINLEGMAIGSMMVSVKDKAFIVKNVVPLELNAFSLAQGSDPLLKNVKLLLNLPKIFYNQDEIQADLKQFEVTNIKENATPWLKASGLIDFQLKNVQPLSSLVMDLNLLLNEATRQPIVAKFTRLEEGTVQASINAHQDDGDMKFKAILDAKGLNGKGVSYGPFDIETHVEGTYENGEIKTQLPFSLKSSKGSSDMTLEALLGLKSPTQRTFNFNLKSDVLRLDDFISLGSVFQAPASSAKSVDTKTVTVSVDTTQTTVAQEKDLTPFWSGFLGDATIQVDRVIKDEKDLITQANLSLKVDENAIDLKQLKGNIVNAPLFAVGDIKFKKNEAKPYELFSNFTLSDLNVGELLKQTSNKKESPVDGIFNLEGKAHASAINIESIVDQIQGEFNMSSDSGVFRPLVGSSKDVQAGAAVLGIVGVINSVAGNKVKELNTVNQLLQYLDKIEYDTFTLKATRNENLDINLDQCIVGNSELKFSGTGKVTYQEGVAITNQPLLFNASLNGKDNGATMLDNVGLLTGNQLEDGYYEGPMFSVRGTVSNPDSTELTSLINKAAMGVVKKDKKLDPGAQETSGSTEGTQEKKTIDKDAIKGIIKGIFN